MPISIINASLLVLVLQNKSNECILKSSISVFGVSGKLKCVCYLVLLHDHKITRICNLMN